VTASVPLADPLRLEANERSAVQDAVAQVLTHGPLVLGEWVERFEREFARFLAGDGRPPEVVGVGSGTDALVVGLAALDLPPGAVVLVPANDGGFAATAVRLVGLTPVATDADEVTQLVDVEALGAAMTPDVRAVVVTHLHGQAVDLASILAWCRERGLTLVEDAAQAHGATVAGRRVGTLADLATFSFYPTKNLGAFGDGGAVVTADTALADRLRRLRQYGWGERFRVEVAGGRNSRLDALQAAVLTARLSHLDRNNARRRDVVGRYREALSGTGAVILGDAPGAVAHHAVVVHPDRDGLVDALERQGIGTCVHYPWLIDEMPGLQMTPSHTPRADRGRRRKVSLPCFPTLTGSEVDQVEVALEGWARSHG